MVKALFNLIILLFVGLPTCAELFDWDRIITEEEAKVLERGYRGSTPSKTVVVLGDKTSGYNETLSDRVDQVLLAQEFDEILGMGDYSRTDLDPDTSPYSTTLANYSDYMDNFWACVGNHDITGDLDLVDGNADEFKEFFGYTSTYYKKEIGRADFFFFDVNLKADGTGYNTILETHQRSIDSFQGSTQGQWLLTQIAASKNKWKVVVFHQPVYSSATTGYKTPGMDWDWAALGVDLVLSGHYHWYERCEVTNASGKVLHVTVGAGGCTGVSKKTPIAESVIQVTAEDEDAIRGSILVLEITEGSITGNLHGAGLSGEDTPGMDTFTIE